MLTLLSSEDLKLCMEDVTLEMAASVEALERRASVAWASAPCDSMGVCELVGG